MPALASFTTPHLVRVKTGALTGKFWLILSNTATTVTTKESNGGVVGVADGDLTGLVAGDACEILPANTLASVFGSPPIASLGTGASASGATVDNVLVWNGSNFDTYFCNAAGTWKKGSITSNNVVIYPDDSVFFVRKVASDLPITLMGTVPSTIERTELISAPSSVSNNFVANRFPVDMTLGTSAIETTPGWVRNSSAGGSDTVLLWNGNTWDTYFCNLSGLWKKGSITSTNVSIPAGSGFFIVRLAGTPNSVLTQNLPYTP